MRLARRGFSLVDVHRGIVISLWICFFSGKWNVLQIPMQSTWTMGELEFVKNLYLSAPISP